MMLAAKDTQHLSQLDPQLTKFTVSLLQTYNTLFRSAILYLKY